MIQQLFGYYLLIGFGFAVAWAIQDARYDDRRNTVLQVAAHMFLWPVTLFRRIFRPAAQRYDNTGWPLKRQTILQRIRQQRR